MGSPRANAEGKDGLIGKTFGQYRVLSLIQRGGMGEIYLAELEPQKIRVVIKRLQDAHNADERYVEMFHNEAALMSQLEHPNIVKVLGVPVIEGKQCLVMEFVRGRNLQQVVRRLRELGKRLPPMMALYVVRKVLLGLHEAHQVRAPDGRSLELVHRDVKPGNVLLSYAGDVKITDFGIAKSLMQNRMTTAGVVKGTVRYLSPEQIKSEKVTCRSDLFSCASVLVEILTDEPLFDRGPVAPTLMAILNGDRPPIASLLPFRAPELARVLEKALSIRPGDRFESARAFSQALGAASRAIGPPAHDDALGGLLRQIFQGSGPTAELEGEDVTYLVNKDASPSSSGRRRSGRPRGSEPLSAEEFSPMPMTEPSGVRSLPPLSPEDGWPEEALAADARASRILDEAIVFDAPVELPSASGEDESIDLEGLDLDGTEDVQEDRGEAEADAERDELARQLWSRPPSPPVSGPGTSPLSNPSTLPVSGSTTPRSEPEGASAHPPSADAAPGAPPDGALVHRATFPPSGDPRISTSGRPVPAVDTPFAPLDGPPNPPPGPSEGTGVPLARVATMPKAAAEAGAARPLTAPIDPTVSTPWVPALQGSGPWHPTVSSAEWQAAQVAHAKDARRKLRIYLLAGCLGGVLLTSAVVALVS